MTELNIADYLKSLSIADLESVKKLIEQREQDDYDANWKSHKRKDDYFYIIHYKDGTYFCHHIGYDAYQKYLNDDKAEWIERKTKDLFPTYEFLERKQTA